MNTLNQLHKNQQGGARVKFVISLVIFAAVIYAGYMYIPVSVDAYYFKDEMQKKVDLAAAQGYDGGWVKDQLVKLGNDYHVPPDASINAAQHDGRMEVHVQFKRPISLPFYTYNYEFDHTATSTAFLSK